MNKNINTFYLYKALVSLELTVPIYVLFLLSNSLSMTQIMILQSYYTMLIFLLEIPSGVIADMFGRKKILTISSFFLTLTFLTFGFGHTFIVFFLAATLWGLAQSFRSGADFALLYDSLSNKANFTKILSKASFIEMLFYGISSIIGGFLIFFYDKRILFFLTAILFFSSIIVTLSFREPKIKKRMLEKKFKNILLKSLKHSVKEKTVRKYTLFFSFFGAMALMLYYIIQPFFQIEYLGITVSGYFIFCAFGALSSKHFIEYKHIIKLILICSAISFILIPFINQILGMILIFVNSFLTGIAGVLANKKINDNTPSDKRATVLSVMNLFQKLIYAIIAPFIGVVIDLYSINYAFIIVGISIFTFLIIFVLFDT